MRAIEGRRHDRDSPFDTFAVRPGSVALFRLGNNGTAHKLLKVWSLTSS